MRTRLISLIAFLLLAVPLAACGGGEEGTPTAEVPGTETPGAETPSAETPGASPAAGPVTIDLWHSEVASNLKTLNALVDRFNASQDEVRVNASFQGTYDDAAAKLVASLPTGNVPAIIFLGDTYMQLMIDSGAAAPVQDFVDRDGYDLSDVDEKGIQYYTSQGTLWAMPFTMEIPLLYYNKVTYREVGLDPEKPPKDLEELRDYSEKILKRDGAGNVVRSGIALDIARWPERVLAEHGDYWVDNENGREGRATKVLFDNDTGRWFFEWWDDMIDKGLAFNVGRNPSMADALLAIAAARAEMAFANTGALRSVVDALEGGIEGVEIGISRLPGVPGGAGQTAVTSYGLWILNVRPQEEQEAAWKFIQWMVQPEQQAEWFAGSGYLPVSRSSVDLPAAQNAVAKYPLFGQALDIYFDAPASPSAVTAALGPVKDVDEAVYRAIEAMISGAKDPDQALEDAAAESNDAISEYNRRVGD